MRSSNIQSLVIILAVIGISAFAFGIPFMVYGERPERHDDIILLPKYSATPTPLDRTLTREAFALRFFTPTRQPLVLFALNANVSPTASGSPTSTHIIPVSGGTATVIATTSGTVTQTPLPYYQTQTKVNDTNPSSPTPTSTLTPSQTASEPLPTDTPELVPPAGINSTSAFGYLPPFAFLFVLEAAFLRIFFKAE